MRRLASERVGIERDDQLGYDKHQHTTNGSETSAGKERSYWDTVEDNADQGRPDPGSCAMRATHLRR